MTVESGDVLNWVIFAMNLTCGKLLKGADWDNWQGSEWKQLDQYKTQGMFNTPTEV